MPRIPKDVSVTISLILTGVFLAVLIFCLFIMPGFVRLILPVSPRTIMTGDAVLITADGYCRIKVRSEQDIGYHGWYIRNG